VTRVLDAAGDPPAAGAIQRAVAALAAGEAIGVPTDTVYGLAARADVAGATAAIFELKGRPEGLALPVLVASVGQAARVGEGLDEGAGGPARRLVEHFWPGGLTVVVRRRPGPAMDLGGDPATVGLRCPDHPVIRALCSEVGPLPTTSANRHGEPPITRAEDVAATFPGLLVLDAGRCDGAPSTVVDCTGAGVRLIREGDIPWARIETALA